MGMMKLLWGMSSSDRWYPSVPGDRGWKPPRGILDWCLRTEDEDNTLGMTQRVSTFNNRAQSMGRTERVSPMVSERDWIRKCSGAGAYEGLG